MSKEQAIASGECPSQEVLAEMLVGRHDPVEFARWMSHVDSCTSCQELAETLTLPDDSLLSELKHSDQRFDETQSGTEHQTTIDAVLAEIASGRLFRAAQTIVEEAPRSIGPYELREEIGRGGMGTVYRAFHNSLRREVAIKMIAGSAPSASVMVRFEREIEALGRLDHASIVRATDAGVADGRPYLVMELIKGPTLSQLVRECGPLSVSDACEVICQAAAGLEYASQQGVIHRDIKPSNLILATSTGTRQSTPVVKILDMGLARFRDHSTDALLTRSHEPIGTPEYLAPEQWEDSHTVDSRADIYALCGVLFFLIAGRGPFQDAAHPTVASKIKAHLTEDPPDIKKLHPDIPPEVAKALTRGLEKDPAGRFASPEELITVLSPFRSGGLANLADRTETAAVGAARPAPRRLLWTCLVLAVLTLVVVAIAGFGWLTNGSTENQVAEISTLEVAHFRFDQQQQSQTRLGLVREQLSPFVQGDELRVRVELSRAAYVQLIALNPNGSAQLAYPADSNTDLQKVESFTWPSGNDYFRLSDGAGQQAFVVVVGNESPPLSSDLASQLDQRWTGNKEGGVWQFHAGELVQVFPVDERPRGDIVSRTSKQIDMICRWLEEQQGVDHVSAIAFGVQQE